MYLCSRQPAIVPPLPSSRLLCIRAPLNCQTTADDNTDWVQLFVTERAQLAMLLQQLRLCLKPDAVIWVSWPKQAAKQPTDIRENDIRDIALPLGFVDIKVCAVDAVWSGLKLMLRRELR